MYRSADRQDAVEHRLQVSRRVRQLYDEDVLAQSAALPGSRQGADAQVPEGAQRGRGGGHDDDGVGGVVVVLRGDGGDRRRRRGREPEDVGRQTVVQAAEAEAPVGQVGGRGGAENHRARLPGTVAQLLRQGLRYRVAGHVRQVM